MRALWAAKICALFAAQLPDAILHRCKHLLLSEDHRAHFKPDVSKVESNTTVIALRFDDSNKAVITFLKVVRPFVFEA